MTRPEHFDFQTPAEAFENSTDNFDLQINLRLRLDEIAEVEAAELRRRPKPPPGRSQLCQLANKIYDARRTRDRIIDKQFFGEPGWDMMLALYFMPARGEMITVTGLSHLSSVPLTTALRWQRLLEQERMIERGPSTDDGRRVLVRLTDRGRQLLEHYLTRLFYCDLPAPPAHPEKAGSW